MGKCETCKQVRNDVRTRVVPCMDVCRCESDEYICGPCFAEVTRQREAADRKEEEDR